MSRSGARRAVRRSYELAHLRAAVRALGLAAVPLSIAFGLHGLTQRTVPFGLLLVAMIMLFSWTGGPWRRGARTGLIAGLPPLVAPLIAFSLAPGHCIRCGDGRAWLCVAVCFTTSTIVGTAVAQRARRDPAPRWFAFAALSVAALTGLLGCGIAGIGGAIGIALGVTLGSIVGFAVGKPASLDV